VSAKDVTETMKRNNVNVQYILRELIPKIPEKRACPCMEALRDAGL
jgi:hypothetical protein